MSCFLLLHEFRNISFNQRVVLLKTHGLGFHDEGFGKFAGAVVLYGDHGAVGDGGVVEQAGFEFGGGDLEALVDVLGTFDLMKGGNGKTYLDLDEFLDAIYHPDMFIPIRRDAELDLVACAHKAALR